MQYHYISPGPVCDRFLQSTAYVCGIKGPIGSGKSTACVMKLLTIAMKQPVAPDGKRHSRFVIIRNTYGELSTTTIKTWHQWIPQSFGRWQSQGPPTHRIIDDSIDAEFMFVALDRPDDVRKLLSMELTGAWINEAREIPKAILDGLTGRVRRYPPKAWGGCIDPQILMDTNPPELHHWWHILAERDRSTTLNARIIDSVEKAEQALRAEGALEPEQPLFEFFAQPSGLAPTAENKSNLDPAYYIAASAGKSEEWVRVYVHGEYGFVQDGLPVFTEYRDTLHCKDFEINPMLPLFVGIDFGLCYSADTEVLTDKGWKLFSDVDEKQDRAATLNPNGFGIEYTDINFKVDYDYDGELIEFKGQNFNFLVTPEHRTPFTHRDTPNTLHFTSAEDLAAHATSHRFIQLQGHWQGQALNFHGLPDDMAGEFLGWYLSEGSTEKIGYSYRVSIAQKKPSPTLDALMQRTEWGLVRWRKDKNGWRATVPRSMGEELFALGKAWTKHAPGKLKLAQESTLRAFLDAYVKGDGHTRTKTKIDSGIGRKQRDEITMATVSARLKDDLQEIALKAGYGSGVRVQKARMSYMADGRPIQCPDIFILTLKRLNRAEIKPEHISRIPYKGKIYCLNVPYHTLYVRRGGKPCWNGNTPAAVIGQRNINGQIRIRHEITTESMGAQRFGSLLADFLKRKYPMAQIEAITGDPAGEHRAQTDERTPYDILRTVGIKAKPAHTNDFTLRREAVARHLTELVDAEPGFIVHPECAQLRRALSGAYRYKRVQVSGDDRYHEQPEKNMASHVAEALQYALLGVGSAKILLSGKVRDRNYRQFDYAIT